MRYRFLAVLMVFSIFFAGCPYIAELSDKALHGTYVGISPISADRGKSFEESKVEFSLNENGFVVFSPVEYENKFLKFRIRYTPSWVFHLTGWGVNGCLAVRQGENAKLAEAIFCFPSPTGKRVFYNGVSVDSVMILGEGMPAILGVFINSAENSSAVSDVQKIYKVFSRPKDSQEQKTRWLKDIDLNEAKKIMRSSDTLRKIQILEKATMNLWTGTEKEIYDRIELVEIGLQDIDQAVQMKALETFDFGGRVRVGANIVANFLRQYRNLRPEVVTKAVEAAVYLLYEAYNYNHDIAFLKKELGTANFEEIEKKTDGLLSPPQHKIIRNLAHRQPQMRWTISDQVILRIAIDEVVMSDGQHVSKEAILNGLKALQEYPLP